jgi:hypothetical protein
MKKVTIIVITFLILNSCASFELQYSSVRNQRITNVIDYNFEPALVVRPFSNFKIMRQDVYNIEPLRQLQPWQYGNSCLSNFGFQYSSNCYRSNVQFQYYDLNLIGPNYIRSNTTYKRKSNTTRSIGNVKRYRTRRSGKVNN